MDIQTIVSYLDIAFIAILVLGGLIGFKRGIFKSTYSLGVFVVLVTLGWILSKSFINVILDASINMSLGEGLYITTLRESLPDLVSSVNEDFGALMVEGTEAYTVVLELFGMIARIIFMVVWLILMATVLKFIFWIVYLIVKPKKRDEEGKKIKKKFSSRLIGAGVGLVHTCLLILLICIPVSGVFSIGSQISELEAATEEIAYTVVPTKDQKLVLLANEPKEVANNETKEIFGMYRQSSFGKFCGMVKLGGESVDEKLFDQLFSFEYNANQIYLKSEIASVINIVNTLNKETNGEITLDNIVAIDTETLYGLMDELSNLKIISVAIPVGAEFLLNSESIKSEMGNLLEDVDAKDLIENLKSTDLNNDFVNLGKGFVDVAKSGLFTALKEKDEEGNSLSIFKVLEKLDEESINNACEKIGDVELLNILGDIGVGYLLKSDAVGKYLESAGMEVSDVNIEGVKLSEEIASIGGIVNTIKSLDLGSQDKIDIESLEQEKLNSLVDALYELKIFNQNTQIVVSIVREEIIPDEYKSILPVKEMNAEDLKSVVKVSKTLLSSTMSEEGESKLDINDLLSDENIEMLITEGKNSEYLSEVINGAGEVLINTLCDSFNINKDNINLEGIQWVDELEDFKGIMDVCKELGIDFGGKANDIKIEEFTDEQISKFANAVFKSNVVSNNTELILSIIKTYAGEELETYIPKTLASEEEFVSFIKLARTILKTADGGNIKIEELDKDELGDALSGLDKDTVNSLISGIVESSGAISDMSNLQLPEVDPSTEEGKEEIQKTLEAMELISSLEDITSVKDLSDNDVSTITSSKIATSIVVSVITDQVANGPLGDFINVEGIEADEWVDSEEGDGELKKLLNATSVLMDENGKAELSTDKLSSLTDEEIATLADSKVITNSLNENLSNLVEETVNSTFGEDYGFEINLGQVEATGDQTTQEAWKEEMVIIREVAKTSEKLDELDLSDKETATEIGNLLDTTKNSQVLGEATKEIASKVLEEAYKGIEGHEAPEITDSINYAEEFAKLQELLKK